MNYSLIFRAMNVVVAAFMMIGGVMTCITGGFPNFIQGIFVIIFGMMILLFEFKLPKTITQFASFMFSFMGRGLFYIFIGCITLSYGSLALASGVIIAVFGVGFVILHFFKNIESPSNMQKKTFQDSMGYSSQSNNPSNAQNNAYPPANYANPSAV